MRFVRARVRARPNICALQFLSATRPYVGADGTVETSETDAAPLLWADPDDGKITRQRSV